MLTPDELRAILIYDAKTGLLTWQGRRNSTRGWNRKYAGKTALNCINSEGYKTGTLDGRPAKAHRVAWAIFYGAWPVGQIDHVNGDRADNRIVNLRCVNPRQNSMNQKVRSDSVSGITGVSRVPSGWKARVGQNYLGTFATAEEAMAARQQANADFGFHPNHGARQ